MSYKTCALLFYFVVFVVVVSTDLIVNTSHGKVKGKVLKTLLKSVEYYGFMGIPYAAPPVKEFRFLPPQSIEPWTGILQATKEKPECIQFNNNIKKGQPFGHYGREDCLYLNIFTPSTQNSQQPIIIFLHNEYLKYSYNKTKDYAPDFFIEEGIIIATISHRLSVFGFLSFEDEILQGNSGLKDIVAGLEWISNNAERFGGDPNRITLLGSQGGAVAVDLLVHTSARKLFNSVILQGGTAWSSLYLHDSARDRAMKLAEHFKIHTRDTNKVLKELSEIEAGDLLAKELDALPQDYNKEYQRGLHPFGPILERTGLVTDYPERSTRIDLPVMIGFNSLDGLEKSLQYIIEPNYLRFVEKDFVMLLPKRTDFRFNPMEKTYEDAVREIKSFYFPNGKVTVSNVPEYIAYMSDLFAFPINEMVEHYSNISSNEVFYYYFDYKGGLNENMNDIMRLSTTRDGTSGAASGDELCYLFRCPRLNTEYLKYHKEATQEISLLKKLVRMWSNFAKYGNPTPKDDSSLDVYWPGYKTETKEFLHIEKGLKIRRYLLQNRFHFWKQFLKKWEKTFTNGPSDNLNIHEEL